MGPIAGLAGAAAGAAAGLSPCASGSEARAAGRPGEPARQTAVVCVPPRGRNGAWTHLCPDDHTRAAHCAAAGGGSHAGGGRDQREGVRRWTAALPSLSASPAGRRVWQPPYTPAELDAAGQRVHGVWRGSAEGRCWPRWQSLWVPPRVASMQALLPCVGPAATPTRRRPRGLRRAGAAPLQVRTNRAPAGLLESHHAGGRATRALPAADTRMHAVVTSHAASLTSRLFLCSAAATCSRCGCCRCWRRAQGALHRVQPLPGGGPRRRGRVPGGGGAPATERGVAGTCRQQALPAASSSLPACGADSPGCGRCLVCARAARVCEPRGGGAPPAGGRPPGVHRHAGLGQQGCLRGLVQHPLPEAVTLPARRLAGVCTKSLRGACGGKFTD